MSAQKYVKWFKEIGKDDIPTAGGKGANLGEMTSFGIPVPPGFVVTSPAYFYFLDQNNLRGKLKEYLAELDENDPETYNAVSKKIKELILKGDLPKDLAVEIMKSYADLGGGVKDVRVAVRSSATAEDLPTASFAGQQETFLNVFGETMVLKKVQACWASLFEARAIFYRDQNKFDHFKVGIAVPVQKMIQSETSGVMFTLNPVTQDKTTIIIEAIYGLGEFIVQGTVTPDQYIVEKDNLKIISKEIFSQNIKLIKSGEDNKKVKVIPNLQGKQKITDKQIVEIARYGKEIHHHYFFPQDLEWAIEEGKIYILQTRPITTVKEITKEEQAFEDDENQKAKKIVLKGIPASPGVATGKVRIIRGSKEINQVQSDEILVTSMTSPDFVPAMKRVVAIITDKGGQTSHAAIVSRELGVPCVVGTEVATKLLKNGQMLTVNGKTGEIYKPLAVDSSKRIWASSPAVFDRQDLIKKSVKTATKIYVNLAEPDLAASVAEKNVDGVGLARAEFMVAQMGIHPKKLIHEKKQKIFIDKLVEGLSIMCEQFSPRPVVYRATDFKTNEYKGLIGGKLYEPEESNPMLGYRGAYRYIADSEVFDLEIKAIKKVREDYKNLNLMIPFVHVPWELHQVKKIIASSGLLRSSTFKLWMMVEIPSNVILLEDFINIGIDGVSIGSNDLTMLILGVDRDNSEVASVFNEMNPAVLWALEKVIRTCNKHGITSSICGQAPSQYPELVEKLVEWGVTSISVNPDVIDKVRETVHDAEIKLLKNK